MFAIRAINTWDPLRTSVIIKKLKFICPMWKRLGCYSPTIQLLKANNNFTYMYTAINCNNCACTYCTLHFSITSIRYSVAHYIDET